MTLAPGCAASSPAPRMKAERRMLLVLISPMVPSLTAVQVQVQPVDESLRVSAFKKPYVSGGRTGLEQAEEAERKRSAVLANQTDQRDRDIGEHAAGEAGRR